jgi:hypothetical protein
MCWGPQHMNKVQDGVFKIVHHHTYFEIKLYNLLNQTGSTRTRRVKIQGIQTKVNKNVVK